MKNLKTIKSVSDLLHQVSTVPSPVFINLECINGKDNYLLDRIIKRVHVESSGKLFYKKLSAPISKLLKEELQLKKNPILLLIKNGEIKATFGGIIAQHQLEDALNNLTVQH